MRSLWMIAAVGAGGAFGAIARHLVSVAAQRQLGSYLPWGTLLANLIGCFLIGLLLPADRAWAVPPIVRMALVTGFLGALTTFSTFGWETMAAAHTDQMGVALLNVGANLMLGLGAVWLGMIIAARVGMAP